MNRRWRVGGRFMMVIIALEKKDAPHSDIASRKGEIG
jgi:hypothetical protein